MGAAEEVPSLVQRSSGDADESAVVLEASASGTFGNVRTNAVRGPYQLPAQGVLRQGMPSNDQRPNPIGDFLGQAIDPKTRKAGFSGHEKVSVVVGNWSREFTGRPMTPVY
jgi:hypothetical protein